MISAGSRDTPQIVRSVEARCRRLGFSGSCRLETGHLLLRLVSAFMGGRILEIGTGCAYGTAWMVSGLQAHAGAQLFTIDSKVELTDSASQLFADQTAVTVLNGDWRTALQYAPFDFVFVDASDAKSTGLNEIVDSLTVGGMVVLDDLTPIELWPEEWRGKPDPIRQDWLHDSNLDSADIRVAPDHAVTLGTKHYPAVCLRRVRRGSPARGD
jgi:predicted O-methyltransferase YrrM